MEVTAYIPLFEQGYKVADLTVHIDPASRAVAFEDKEGNRRQMAPARAHEILTDIRLYDRDKWRELEQHSRAGCPGEPPP